MTQRDNLLYNVHTKSIIDVDTVDTYRITAYKVIQSIRITINFDLDLRYTKYFELNFELEQLRFRQVVKWLRISETSN